jgi:hypothetical protein
MEVDTTNGACNQGDEASDLHRDKTIGTLLVEYLVE